MNTGITPFTPRPPDLSSARSDASATVSGSSDPAAAKAAAGSVSLPVDSNSVDGKSAASAARKADEAKDKPSLQEVIELSEKLNENVQRIQRDLNFTVDEHLGEIVVKVIDRGTQEVIRQIPSEEMLSLSRNIEEVNSLLFDQIKA